MGLPVELWKHIISFLPPDVPALYACLFTCKSFSTFAQEEIFKLAHPRMILDDHTDIKQLAEEIVLIPGRAECIKWLKLQTTKNNSSENSVTLSTLSVVPHQLPVKLLPNLEAFSLDYLQNSSSVHPSTWPLLGSVFHHVTELYLFYVQFPSFV